MKKSYKRNRVTYYLTCVASRDNRSENPETSFIFRMLRGRNAKEAEARASGLSDLGHAIRVSVHSRSSPYSPKIVVGERLLASLGNRPDANALEEASILLAAAREQACGISDGSVV